MEQSPLNQLRVDIDQVDRQIIALLAERFKLTEEVGQYKAQQGLPAQDPFREQLQFNKIAQLSEECGLKPGYASDIYRLIMDLAIARHRELRQESPSCTASGS
ncbi:chorismate mutase [Paenibacillus phyllosphaerae]|uniref:Chorismate mutase n=1 Tax=Paenibacillus phyllosphaerae TaxID=274593 RepID=A0A7W5AXY9_9BACL|nr:chorismate mutase [Paenibacillus phyllosphaerae]MBB3110824.1 chorismate mutase [Paenibacillus phyllosphaerae]